MNVLLRRRVLHYCRRWVPTQRAGSDYRWTGSALVVTPPGGHEGWRGFKDHREWSQHLLHDVNHWRTCSESRRKLPEFGLGEAPYTNTLLEPTARYPHNEEIVATMLDVLTMLRLGFEETIIHDWWTEVSPGVTVGSKWRRRTWRRRIRPLLEDHERRWEARALEVVCHIPEYASYR